MAGESSGMRILGLWTDTLIPLPFHGDIISGQTVMQSGNERNKSYEIEGRGLPFVFWPDTNRSIPDIYTPSYFSQIEAVLGVVISVRVGFNPGELLDFILGWFGIDIYDDDIDMMKLKTKSNQQSQRTACSVR